MAVKESRNWLSQQRVDIPDLRAVESGVIFDFKTLLQCFVGNDPYILRGFTIPVTGIAGPATALQMVVNGAEVWIPGDINGSMLRVESGTPNEVLSTANTKVIGSFGPGINYVGIRFKRATDASTTDLVSIWDVDSQSEFTKTAPRGVVMSYEIVVDGASFGDTSPVALVEVSGSNVISIENAKTNPFRLGRGGASPDPNYSHAYAVNPENNLTATSNSDPDPFAGGDWELQSFKDWMDAVMTEIKTMKGSAYWYSVGSTLVPGINLSDLFFDAASSVITGVGKFDHDNTTPGLLTWTSNILVRSIIGPLTFIITQGNVTLGAGQVAYITVVRNQDFQPSNTFTFLNGNATVTATNTVSGISAGDWVKYNTHSVQKWAKVSSVVGSTITLTSPYQGANAVGKALRTQGTYTMSTANAENVPASGDTFWFAKRDDGDTPSTATVTNVARTSDIATITTSAAHGLKVGQSISVSGATPVSFNGTFELETASGSTITFYNPGPNVVSSGSAGTIATRAKIYLRALGELEQGEDRQIDDNTTMNILKFIGSESESDTTPPYTIFPNALSLYTFTTNDSLTKAISQITGNVNEIFTILDQPSYDETIEIVSGAPGPNQLTGPVVTGTTITLPVNSRLSGSPQQFYKVGNGALEIFISGQFLRQGVLNGWNEVGSVGSLSSTIVINQQLEVNDELHFRLDATGGPASGSPGAPDDNFVTLPTSSSPDNADFVLIWDSSIAAYRKQTRAVFLSGVTKLLITNTYAVNHLADTNLDDLIRMNAASGNLVVTLPDVTTVQGKVFYVKKVDATSNTVTITPFGGDLIDGMTGIILTDQYSLYAFVSNGTSWDAMQAYNPNTVGVPALARAIARQALNATGSTIAKFTPVRIISAGMALIDPSIESQVDDFAGITRATTLNGNIGEIVKDGIIEDVTTAFVVGDPVYVSKTGGVTNVKPDIGVGGFVAGDFVIRIGFIVKNNTNALLKDMFVCIEIVGQL